MMNYLAIQTLRDKCEKLEKEKADLLSKMQTGDFVDLDTLHQVKQEKHKLQKEVYSNDYSKKSLNSNYFSSI